MKLPFIFLLALAFDVYSQTAEQDSSSFDATMQWLERKLTYNYYDATNGQWWVNVIQKKDNGAFTIKNIAAKHPDRITGKIYYQRTFFLWDLDPNKITVSDIPKDMGRFVKGKLIRLEGFKDENKIATKKDGRVGSKVSYLHISIPTYLEDSLQDYSIKVKEKLTDALYLNARLFNANDEEKNLIAAFNTLSGNYISEDSTSYLDFDVLAQRLIRFKVRKDSQIKVGTIGYDEEKKTVFYFQASATGHLIKQFTLDQRAGDLILKNEEGDSIFIIGRNTIEFSIEGEKKKYVRY